MYDLLDKRSTLTLGRGTFIYASIVWRKVNSFWAVGYYLLEAAATSASPLSSFGGYDGPFSFGFYVPLVPRTVMILCNVMNLFAVYVIWKRKTVRVALAGIFLPILFVNFYAFLFGKVVPRPLAIYVAKKL